MAPQGKQLRHRVTQRPRLKPSRGFFCKCELLHTWSNAGRGEMLATTRRRVKSNELGGRWHDLICHFFWREFARQKTTRRPTRSNFTQQGRHTDARSTKFSRGRRFGHAAASAPKHGLRAFNRFYAYVVARIVRRHQKPYYRVFAFGSGIRFPRCSISATGTN